MRDFEEQERRLMAALGRLGSAIERLTELPPAAEAEGGDMLDSAAEVEIARLSHLLETARNERAESEARHALGAARQAAEIAALQAKLQQTGGQTEAQAGDVQRLRLVNVQLREALRGLRGALEASVVEPEAINRALEAELEALQAARALEASELDALLQALDPLISAAPATPQQPEADNA